MKDSSIYKENQNLANELKKLEKMMSKLRQEKEELAQKYNTLLESSAAGSNETEYEQGHQIRRKDEKTRQFEDECNRLKQKIEGFQANEQRQNELVQRLQTKVLQFKEKADLAERKYYESKNNEFVEFTAKNANSEDKTNLVQMLEEQDNRNSALMRINTLLREQLEKGTDSNQQLTVHVQSLTEELENTKLRTQEVERQLQNRDRRSEEMSMDTQQQLLQLWRDFCELRNQFFVGKGNSERELAHSRQEISIVFEKIKNYYETFANQAKIKQAKMQNLSSDFDQVCSERESILNSYKTLEERYSMVLCESGHQEKEILYMKQRLEQSEQEKMALNYEKAEICNERTQEVESVCSGLRQICSIVLNDEELDKKIDLISSFPILQNLGYPHKPALLAGAAVSVVSALSSSSQFKIKELKAKLAHNNEKVVELEGKVAESAKTEQIMQGKLTDLLKSVETRQNEIQMEAQESKRLRNRLKEVEDDLKDIEKERDLFKDKLDSTNKNYDDLLSQKNRLLSCIDGLKSEKDELLRENSRQNKEIERGNLSISRLEKAISVTKEELVFTKELSDRMELDKDLAEKQLTDLIDSKDKLEREKKEIEDEARGLRSENSDLEAYLENERKKAEVLACEKDKLGAQLNKTNKKLSYEQCERNKLEGEILNLRNDIMAIEHDRSEVELELNSGNLQIECLEKDIQRLEFDLTENIREKNEIFSHYKKTSRQKNSLTEEIMSLQNELAKMAENCHGLKKEREKMTESAEALKEKIKFLEEDDFKQREYLDASEAERETLERTLRDFESRNSSLVSQNKYIEAENYELKNKNSTLTNEVNSTIKEKDLLDFTHKQEIQKLVQTHNDVKNHLDDVIRQLKQVNEDERKDLLCRMERVQHDCNLLIEEMNASMAQKTAERSMEYQKAIEEEKKEINRMQEMYEDEIARLKTSKYEMTQKLSFDNKMLKEANDEMITELESLKKTIDSVKSEFSEKTEADKTCIAKLQDELHKNKEEIQNLLDQSMLTHRNLTEKVNTFSSEREKAKSEVSTLQRHVAGLEEDISHYIKTISTLNMRVEDLKDEKDGIFAENHDLNKLVKEEKYGREMASESLDRLREKVRILETEKSETYRALAETKASASKNEDHAKRVEEELERLKSCLRQSDGKLAEKKWEIQGLEKELESLGREKQQFEQDKCGLLDKIEGQNETHEIQQREIEFYRQNICELEETLNGFYNNLNNVYRTQTNLEECLENKNRDYQHVVEDLRLTSLRMNEDKDMLEKLLQKSHDKNTSLTMSLRALEGRLSVLEDQLRQTEHSKKETARKLEALCAVIRRFVGVESRPPRARSSSPLRERVLGQSRRGQSLTRSETHVNEQDIFPFKAAILNFSSRLMNSERSRDELQTQCRLMQTNLDDLYQRHDSLDIYSNKLKNSLNLLENEKADLIERLHSAQSSLTNQGEVLRKVERDKKACKEKLMDLEHVVYEKDAEIRSIVERIGRIRADEAKMGEEFDSLRKNLAETQMRCRHFEETNGKLQEKVRLLNLQHGEKSHEIFDLQNKREKDAKVIDEVGRKNVHLQTTIDNLSKTITKFEEMISEFKENAKKQSRIIQENEMKMEDLNVSLKEVRSEMEDREKERNMLDSKINRLRNQITELKKENSTLSDSMNKMENQILQDGYKMMDLEGEAVSKTEQCLEIKAENEKLRFKVEENSKREEQLESKVKRIQKELKNLMSERDSLEDKLEKIHKNMKMKEVEREKMNDDFEWREKNYEKENVQLSHENRLLQTHINDLSDQIEFFEDDDRDHQMRVFSLQNEINELKSQLRSRAPKCIFNQSN